MDSRTEHQFNVQCIPSSLEFGKISSLGIVQPSACFFLFFNVLHVSGNASLRNTIRSSELFYFTSLQNCFSLYSIENSSKLVSKGIANCRCPKNIFTSINPAYCPFGYQDAFVILMKVPIFKYPIQSFVTVLVQFKLQRYANSLLIFQRYANSLLILLHTASRVAISYILMYCFYTV